ncbi:hypothetical protein J3458_007024 [Metarhizium acridum]|uniref:uncharacterized protein n=1 Tax=Metarhizium acridum TaxID=92637 RepID=UPI001C6B63CA|nr:hypothetical protein J3458_007024 [Metarhizium acridum]
MEYIEGGPEGRREKIEKKWPQAPPHSGLKERPDMAGWAPTPVSRLLAAGCGQVRSSAANGSCGLEAQGLGRGGRRSSRSPVEQEGQKSLAFTRPNRPALCSPSCPDSANRNGDERG